MMEASEKAMEAGDAVAVTTVPRLEFDFDGRRYVIVEWTGEKPPKLMVLPNCMVLLAKDGWTDTVPPRPLALTAWDAPLPENDEKAQRTKAKKRRCAMTKEIPREP